MTEQAISPLRRRMIEDMSIRKFAAKTQHDYAQRVKDFATFLGRSPATSEAEGARTNVPYWPDPANFGNTSSRELSGVHRS
jgi:hypothetical protein